MAFSSGLRRAFGLAASWLAVSASVLAMMLYHDELKSGMALLLGLPEPTERVVLSADAKQPSQPSSRGNSVELRAASGGHFVTTAHVNGRPVEVMVDTGASIVALSYSDAERAGVFVRPSDFTQRVSTANGSARIAPVILDSVSIGDITLYDVRAAVSEPGRLQTSLLGMTFLGRLARTEMRNGVLVLEE
jgi:aspartyl protease family protein